MSLSSTGKWMVALGLGLWGCTNPVAPVSGLAGEPLPDSFAVEEPLPAAAPAPASDGCPDGWTVGADGLGCTAWEPEPPPCTGATARFPGATECQPIGTPCGAGPWAPDLPRNRPTVFVRADAAPGGDGSRELPFDRIAPALASASSGAIVALSRGVYDEAITVRRPVTLWGACAAETILTSSSPSRSSGTVRIETTATELRALTVSGERPGVWMQPGSAADLDAVVISDATLIGWVVGGARASARDLVIRGTRSITGLGARGIDAEVGAELEIARAALVGNRGPAIFADRPSTVVRATDVSIVGPVDGSGAGDGVLVQRGARVELDRVMIERPREAGVVANREDSAVVLHDAVIRDAVPSATGGGRAVEALLGGRVELSRVAIERPALGGILVEEGSVHAVGLVVREPGREAAVGLHRGSEAVLASAHLIRGAGGGILVADDLYDLEATHPTPTRLTMTDAFVDQTIAGPEGMGGYGVEVRGRAVATLHRVAVRESHDVGIYVREEGARLTAEDLGIVEMHLLERDRTAGYGLAIEQGARAEVMRLRVDAGYTSGLVVAGEGSFLGASDVTVSATRPQPDNGLFGRGLTVQHGGVAAIERLVVSDNREVGVAVAGPDARADLVDVLVTRTLARECSRTSCRNRGAGMGLAAIEGATASLRAFVVSDNHLAGIQVGHGSAIDLMEGSVAGQPIGANIQDPGFDTRRLFGPGVEFVDNERNVDAAVLPVPDATLPSRP